MNITSIWKYLKDHQSSNYSDIRDSLLKLYDNYDSDTARASMLQGYCSVINDITSQPASAAEFKHNLTIRIIPSRENTLCDADYVDVSLVNEEYEGPADTSLKPWGGDGYKKDDAPEGHYNANWIGYYPIVGLGPTPWNEFIFSDIVVDDSANKMSIHDIMANVMYKMTFNGYSEAHIKEFWDAMDDRVQHAKDHPESLKEFKTVDELMDYVNELTEEDE